MIRNTAIDNPKLQAVGLITGADLIDLWGGKITLQPGEDTPEYVKIIFNDIPY
ncbi:hypothetical protein [Coxiella-like endosymbiont]|uniref:hypothetical protein n=1 Tax=Coxiella-like endosymbiont TaxID=1592897 RepID=UPI00272C5154|nr:hypothetical protein [Coxiella-like endosymbiont]